MTKSQQRANAIRRAQAAYDRISDDPRLTRTQLGHLRDRLRRVRTIGDPNAILEDLRVLEEHASTSPALDSPQEER